MSLETHKEKQALKEEELYSVQVQKLRHAANTKHYWWLSFLGPL